MRTCLHFGPAAWVAQGLPGKEPVIHGNLSFATLDALPVKQSARDTHVPCLLCARLRSLDSCGRGPFHPCRFHLMAWTVVKGEAPPLSAGMRLMDNPVRSRRRERGQFPDARITTCVWTSSVVIHLSISSRQCASRYARCFLVILFLLCTWAALHACVSSTSRLVREGVERGCGR